VSIDTETTGPQPIKVELVGISFSLDETESVYLPLGHYYLGAPEQINVGQALDILRPVLEDETLKKIGQNMKYDALVLRQYGIDMKGLYFDTMIASYVLNPSLRQHNLEALAQHYLGYKMISYKEVVGRGKNEVCFSAVETDRAMEYSCEDADITLRLKTILEQKLESDQNQELFHHLEMRLLPVLIDMEWAGVRIDTVFLKDMSVRLSKELKKIEQEIYDEAGMTFNINSSQQLGHVLFEKLGLPVQKKTTKTKAYSTDVKVLQQLSAMPFKIPKLLLRYRTLSKLKSTYLEALVKMVNPRTNRVHTSYNQTVTATGRLSSSNPNLQNIPIRGEEGREIRKGFIAEDGHLLLSADYSQVELRIFAHYADDPILIEAFNKGEDIHSRTASEILGLDKGDLTPDMRRMAKAINFGIIYGMGPKKLSEELGLDHATAKKYIESYYERYQGVRKYRQETIERARRDGYVTTLFNRRRYVPEINHDKQRIRAEAERMAVNTPIQGTAADLIKMAMINIHHRLNQEAYKTRMLMQVHDELVFEAPEEEAHQVAAMIKEEMETVHTLKVPLRVDLNMGRNWDEAH
jgi:DNA polymerase-1